MTHSRMRRERGDLRAARKPDAPVNRTCEFSDTVGMSTDVLKSEEKEGKRGRATQVGETNEFEAELSLIDCE